MDPALHNALNEFRAAHERQVIQVKGSLERMRMSLEELARRAGGSPDLHALRRVGMDVEEWGRRSLAEHAKLTEALGAYVHGAQNLPDDALAAKEQLDRAMEPVVSHGRTASSAASLLGGACGQLGDQSERLAAMMRSNPQLAQLAHSIVQEARRAPQQLHLAGNRVVEDFQGVHIRLSRQLDRPELSQMIQAPEDPAAGRPDRSGLDL
jgi:hypothetical protein